MKFLLSLELKLKQFPKAAFAAFILAAIAALGPFVVTHFHHLWNRPHYQFFPMMGLAIGGLAVARYRDAPAASISKNKIIIHLPLLLFGLAALATAYRLNSPWVGFLSAVCLLLLFTGTVPKLSSAFYPLLILLPLPFSMDQDLVHFLQKVSSVSASALLDAFGILHIMSGNVLEVNGGQFFVEEACSGIGSVFLLLASVAIYASWKQLRLVLTVPMLIAAVGWAVAANTFRIFVVAWSHAHAGPNLSSGTPHEILGAITYVAALLMLALTEQLLLFLLDPIVGVRSIESPKTLVEQFTAVLVTWWNRMTSMDSACLPQRESQRGISGILVSRRLFYMSLAVVLLPGGVRNGWDLWRSAQVDSSPAQSPITLPAPWSKMKSELFDDSSLNCQLESFADRSVNLQNEQEFAGRNNKSWKMSVAGTPVQVTLCGPVEKSRNLRERYGSAGWKILQSATHPLPKLTDHHLAVSELVLHNDDGKYLHVFVSSFRKSAVIMTIPAEGSIDGVNLELASRLSGSDSDPEDPVWEVQLQIPSSRPIESSARPYWQRSFEELFTTILNKWRLEL